jgi:hypothetical protein
VQLQRALADAKVAGVITSAEVHKLEAIAHLWAQIPEKVVAPEGASPSDLRFYAAVTVAQFGTRPSVFRSSGYSPHEMAQLLDTLAQPP